MFTCLREYKNIIKICVYILVYICVKYNLLLETCKIITRFMQHKLLIYTYSVLVFIVIICYTVYVIYVCDNIKQNLLLCFVYLGTLVKLHNLSIYDIFATIIL